MSHPDKSEPFFYKANPLPREVQDFIDTACDPCVWDPKLNVPPKEKEQKRHNLKSAIEKSIQYLLNNGKKIDNNEALPEFFQQCIGFLEECSLGADMDLEVPRKNSQNSLIHLGLIIPENITQPDPRIYIAPAEGYLAYAFFPYRGLVSKFAQTRRGLWITTPHMNQPINNDDLSLLTTVIVNKFAPYTASEE